MSAKKRRWWFAIGLTGLLLFAVTAQRATVAQSDEQLKTVTSVFDETSGNQGSGMYQQPAASGGQPTPIGFSTSGQYQNFAGYLYTLEDDSSALNYADTCWGNSLVGYAEDFLVGGNGDLDRYAIGFYNPHGEARLLSVSFEWFDAGEIDMWVYLGPEKYCPACAGDGDSPLLGDMLRFLLGVGFEGMWTWESHVFEGQPIYIPAKTCFYIVWKMKDGTDSPRILGDAGHGDSQSWIWNGVQEEWKCFSGYEYRVVVCLDYNPGCVLHHDPDITWSHPEHGTYPCEGDDYTVKAVFQSVCDTDDDTLDVCLYEASWGLFTLPEGFPSIEPHCSTRIVIPAGRADTVTCACEYYHYEDLHNWWARNIVVRWTRDVDLGDEDPEKTWVFTRKCRMTVWPDGPWDKEPVRWGLVPMTIPVWNDDPDLPVEIQLFIEDLPDGWRADLSNDFLELQPLGFSGDRDSVLLTVWPEGETEPDEPTVIKVRAFKYNDEWGEVEIEFMPYPEHFYLGPDGRPVQPVHVEDIRWSPMYPCENTAYDVWATVVNDGPNSAYPKISFGLAPWGFFTPALQDMVYDTVLWGGLGGFRSQIVAPYHYKTPWFEYEDLECNYYQQYAQNIVIDYPVIRRHCYDREDSVTAYLRDCERWLWPKNRWVDEDSTWRPVSVPIPVYNEEPYYDCITLWIGPDGVPSLWEYSFDEQVFCLEPEGEAEANLTIIPRGSGPPSPLPARVVVHARKGFCERDTEAVDIKFMPYTGMCLRDTSGIKTAYRYSESCGGGEPTVVPGDIIQVGLLLDNESSVSAVQIKLGYDAEYMKVVNAQTTARTAGFELVQRTLGFGLHEISLYSTPTHPLIGPSPKDIFCGLPPGYEHEGLLSIVTVSFEILTGAPAGVCADIRYESVILDGLPDWEGHPKEPLCLKFEDKGQICFGGYLVPGKCDLTGTAGEPDTMVTLVDLLAILKHMIGQSPFPEDGNGDKIPDVTQPGQSMWSADANGDQVINIIDLMKCINLAVGVCDPKVVAADVAVREVIGLTGRRIAVPVDVSSEGDVVGVLLRFGYDGEALVAGEPALTDRSKGMAVDYGFVGDELVVLISGRGGEVIEAGAGSVLRVPFALGKGAEDAFDIEIKEPVLFTVDGGLAFGVSSVVTVKWEDFIPTEYSLAQNYPNPFNPVTSIRYNLPEAARVRVAVYNTLGQVVTELVDGTQEAGYHVVKWEAGEMASGVYFYRIVANEFTATRRMVLMK